MRITPHTLATATVLITSAFITPLSGAADKPAVGTMAAATHMHKQAASTMIHAAKEVIESLGTGNTAAILRHVSTVKYIQHNPNVPDGRDALIGFAQSQKDGNAKVVRAFADGDFVVLHTHYQFGESSPIKGEFGAFDVFRFEDGKIVEHWDNLQAFPATTASGRSLVDGPAKVLDVAQTEANKQLVKNFMDQVIIGGDFSKLSTFISTQQYDQHNPNIGDGLDGLGKAVAYMAKNNIAMRYDRVYKYLGQGNFVLAISEGEFGGKKVAFYDMWRVQDGKLVEHWDVLENLLPAGSAKNGNGKIF